ncbi:ribosome-associated translation inhibitor RaiA [Sporolactobacillus sp. THM7-4]|nr:ribosome-associated translation inhibitor RaiA [Sporolactobacillus sp. THM7-4]
MNVNIRGENIEMTSSLQDYAEKKISKLEKYFNSPLTTDAHVNMRVHNKEQVIEVTIPMQGLLLRAEVGQDDMYAAIDLVVSKLERQIKKYKTKIYRKSRQDLRQARKAEHNSLAAVTTGTVDPDTKNNDDSLDVVRTKRFVMKPMTVEEAILQMGMLGHTFFVFKNALTGAINVVYSRKDGRYGLIDEEE